jgi:predicted signal transduction protein with EAL and GGDEF domain
MSDYKKWLANYTVSVNFPAVSGFEILEMLQARSHLAQIENSLNAVERAELESADAIFLAHANEFYASLSEIANLRELRAKTNTLPSHWWWHLDKLVQQRRETVAV